MLATLVGYLEFVAVVRDESDIVLDLRSTEAQLIALVQRAVVA